MIVLLSCTAAPAMAATLADSVNYAIANHPKISAEKAAKDAAVSNIKEQRAAYFPTVSVNSSAGGLRADDETTRANTGGDARSWFSEGTATFSQPVFAGFSNMNRIGAAKDRLASSSEDVSTAEEAIALAAARAHLNIMRTREMLNTANGYLNDIRERRQRIDMMVKEGAANEADLLQAGEIVMAAQTSLLQYEEAYRQSEVEYIEAVGFLPTGALRFGGSEWVKLIPPTLDDAIRVAHAHSPRLLAAGKGLLPRHGGGKRHPAAARRCGNVLYQKRPGRHGGRRTDPRPGTDAHVVELQHRRRAAGAHRARQQHGSRSQGPPAGCAAHP